MPRPTWNEQDLMILRRMLADKKTSVEIGEAVNRNPTTVRQFIRNNADSLGLDIPMIRGRYRYNPKSFEKQWLGSVPYLHWAMTKPWSKRKAS